MKEMFIYEEWETITESKNHFNIVLAYKKRVNLIILNNYALFLKALSRALGEEKFEGTEKLVKLHF